MDLFSDVGGVYQSLFIVGSFIAGYIAKRLLYAAMIEQIYHIHKNESLQKPIEKQKTRIKVEDLFLAKNE